MNKRTYERTNINVQANILYGNAMHTGIVTNFSNSGMYINTDSCPPVYSQFNVFFDLQDQFLEVPVEVKRLIQNDGFDNGMGVEVQNSDNGYLKFLESLKSIKCDECKHNNYCHFLNSDAGDLRFLLNDKCEYYMLDTR